MAKTKLSNAELDVIKERLLTTIINALNESGEDCGLATSYGKKTLCANLPYAENEIEGIFEISIINKTDMDYEDMLNERENLGIVRAERTAKAEETARKKAEKIAKDNAKREAKARAKAESETSAEADEGEGETE